MTAERGDRALGSRRAHGDDDEDDALDGGDAQLRAMRTVWLAMRDEEPPSGGLAELMAAARGKASELAPRPTLWQRLLAGMRRPPALAFATVFVLLGGVVVVSRRVDHKAAPVASVAQEEPSRARGGAGLGEAEPPRLPAAAPAGGDQGAAPASPGLDEAPPASPRRGKAAEVVTTRADQGPPPVTLATPEPARHGAKKVRRAPVPPDDLEGDVTGAPTDRLQDADAPGTAGRGVQANEPSEPPPPAPAPASIAVDGRLDGGESKQERARSGATPAALYRACEAAATRGDCAEVRRVVEQISKTDRGYRARIAKGSRIAACLVE